MRLRVVEASSNRCCVCQTPFIQIHHLDRDPSNNDFDNVAPLCPNCHSQSHSTAQLTVNLTADRIKALRDRWYAYSDRRRDFAAIGANALLKLKNFVRSVGLAQYSWARSFADVNPAYAGMTREEIINNVFSTSNRDDLVVYLNTVRQMYQVDSADESVQRRFEAVCNAFGIGYDELP